MNYIVAIEMLCCLINTEALYQLHSDQALAPLNRYWFWKYEFGGD